MIKSLLILTITIFGLYSGANAQGFLKVNNKQIVDGNNQEIILRGMGLGGWMLQEGYMMQTADFANTQHELKNKIAELIGQGGMEAFYDAWLANHVREIDIDSLASWDFNSVRLPMHYNLFTLPIEDEPVAGQNTWLQKGFELTDSLLKWCSKNHIYLILDLHATPGGQGKDAAISDYDPAKPALWENINNWKKTVALWKKLAERYANEEWIGGYDLINETNWDLSGNILLKNLYKEITDSIRKVDQNHIIFIEGNWFANDFTGLTPPWDNNMVYSFHKYWTYNNQSSIQWMLDIRNNYNIPVWLGESGENSNTWFKECIKLLEDNNIGWAWWPMKKIGSIAGPFSAIKTDEYETLLKYWKGEAAKPTVEYATNALMQMAENMKLENCEYHPDVTDAMFRQISSSESKPYNSINIPGSFFATNFDLGPNGISYFDRDTANYHLSTNNYVAWNKGWSYRNDGVDIEPCSDADFSNGFNVGYTEKNEWMQYTVNISKTATYAINVRTASNNSNGLFHFQEDEAYLSPQVNVANTGGGQIWQTTAIENVILTEGLHKLKFFVDIGNFNVNSFVITETGETTDLPAEIVSAVTGNDVYTIHLNINKPISSGISSSMDDFVVKIDGNEVEVQSIDANSSSNRVIDIIIANTIMAENSVLLSYTGTQIEAFDGTMLSAFTDEIVINTLPQRHHIPVKIKAEDYYQNSGLSPEDCSDTGGGTDMGWTDSGDYLDYLVSVSTPGTYHVDYRIASQDASGQIEMQLIGNNTSSLHTIDLPVTGGWQIWNTVGKELWLPAGDYTIRLLIKKSGFNINWFKFDLISGINSSPNETNHIQIYPNPAMDIVFIKSEKNQLFPFDLIDLTGKVQKSGKISTNKPMDVSKLTNGIYFLKIYVDNNYFSYKIVINND